MAFRAVTLPDAFDRVIRAQVPVQLVDRLVTAIEHELAENPSGLSRPSSFPHPADSQLYHYQIEFDGFLYHFSVFFRYGQDEQTLLIHDIGVARYRLP